MDLRTLRVFVEIARRGSLAEAAKAVCATQSAVSKAMKGLEAEIGVPLLVRSGRGKVLTPEGEVLSRRALNMLHEFEALQGELSELQQLQRGRLRIGFPGMAPGSCHAGLFSEFRERYPGVEVAVSVEPMDRLDEHLRSGELDLALLVAPRSPDLDWQYLWTEPMVAVLPGDGVPDRVWGIRAAALARWPLLLFREGRAVNEALLGAFGRKGLKPQVSLMAAGPAEFVLELVARGLGAAILPRAAARWSERGDVRCLPIEDIASIWHFALAWRRGSMPSSAARAWLTLAEAHAQGRRREGLHVPGICPGATWD
ncbi:LysR family transcriptional regulator [Paracidovorax anthurii]|uniref:DNA-binding transcriptional LysR family regulator n=1 Tax=Paracidovorax anthurii TaxID=78229 RepID=A0A328YX20_9BURK|nr:LysR family transcriptional regulator [Paracidovorax anthurii]RAR78551.1 DNA-binding transcriptional LysR family regulator [Paracidovorax anthurii]